MDGLPYDLVLHIVSYLPGNDVVRFKRLNSNFGRIIQKNRYNLNYPKFTMYIDHEFGEYREEKEIIDVMLYGLPHCKEFWGAVSCKVNFMDPHGVKVTIDRKYYKKWRPPLVYHHCSYKCSIFYPLLCGKTSLRSFFDFVLEKGDIELKTSGINNPDIFCALTESIKYSSRRIRTVKMGVPTMEEEYDLLMAVTSLKRNNYKYPRLEIQCFASHLERDWANLKKLNDIAPMFRKARMQFVDDDIEKIRNAIIQNWLADPFPTMNFSLRPGRLNCLNATPWEAGIHYKIEVDEKKTLQFKEMDSK